jgi:hypothetical protein
MADVGPKRGDGRWLKSSYSGGASDCVEIRDVGDFVAVRDSKHPETVLRFTRAEWHAFLDAVKRGELDRTHSPKSAMR